MYVKIHNRQSPDGQFSILECDRVSKDEGGDIKIIRRGEIVSTWVNGRDYVFFVMNDAGDTIDRWRGTAGDADGQPAAGSQLDGERLTFHSGTTLKLETGGALNISRYATESGALRTTITVPHDSTVPIPAMNDRDVGVLCGILMSFTFAPEAGRHGLTAL